MKIFIEVFITHMISAYICLAIMNRSFFPRTTSLDKSLAQGKMGPVRKRYANQDIVNLGTGYGNNVFFYFITGEENVRNLQISHEHIQRTGQIQAMT
jgi:hypothetical protein